MRTPAGTECRYYYEDYNRGRATQECRLIQSNPASAPWRPGMCRTCPVPGILQANACPNMELEARVGRRWLVLPQVRVRAYCRLTEQVVAEPMVGCGHCQDERWRAIEERLRDSG
jgi:hypothetical protein